MAAPSSWGDNWKNFRLEINTDRKTQCSHVQLRSQTRGTSEIWHTLNMLLPQDIERDPSSLALMLIVTIPPERSAIMNICIGIQKENRGKTKHYFRDALKWKTMYGMYVLSKLKLNCLWKMRAIVTHNFLFGFQSALIQRNRARSAGWG